MPGEKAVAVGEMQGHAWRIQIQRFAGRATSIALGLYWLAKRPAKRKHTQPKSEFHLSGSATHASGGRGMAVLFRDAEIIRKPRPLSNISAAAICSSAQTEKHCAFDSWG